jgi:hypothetical protein
MRSLGIGIGLLIGVVGFAVAAEYGWKELFNGKDLTGWVGKGWIVEDGAIARKAGGMLYSAEQYGDFVLDLEFKISKGGNSGVFVRTGDMKDPVQTGFEIQVFDSVGKTKLGKHDCGALYDALAPAKNVQKPLDQWNRMVITCKGNRITVEMNGEQILDADLDKWTESRKNPDGSPNKFNTPLKDFPRKGYIGLQDHGSPVWYRNIKVKAL